jgi:hypothetical protein
MWAWLDRPVFETICCTVTSTGVENPKLYASRKRPNFFLCNQYSDVCKSVQIRNRGVIAVGVSFDVKTCVQTYLLEGDSDKVGTQDSDDRESFQKSLSRPSSICYKMISMNLLQDRTPRIGRLQNGDQTLFPTKLHKQSNINERLSEYQLKLGNACSEEIMYRVLGQLWTPRTPISDACGDSFS